MRPMVAAVFGLAMALAAAHAETVTPATPIDRQSPAYPETAGRLEGFVKLRFTIASDGRVKDVVPFESNPTGVFDSAAVGAVARWIYHPRMADGRPVEQPGNEILLRFKPSASVSPVWLNPEPPLYPRKAYDAKLEGWVKVAFDVSPLGMTMNTHVVESSAPGVFDQQAMQDVDDRVFQVPVVNGQRLPISGATATIEFKLDKARVAPTPVHRIPPEYPKDADAHNTMGYCSIDYTVEPDGSVSNPVVAVSYPKGVFEKATLAAVAKWKFEPPVGAVSNTGHTTVRYLMWGLSPHELHYLKRGQWVKLEYTLSADGHVKDIKVVDKSDPDVNVTKAVEQLKSTNFPLIVKDGVAVEQTGRTVRIGNQE